MTKTEAYHVFGLSENQPVTIDLIKNRYRILTKTYHPDNPRTGSEAMMAKVNLAFDALRTYTFDEEGTEGVHQPKTGTGFEKEFNPDFSPFEYGSRDESFYQNNRREQENSYAGDYYGDRRYARYSDNTAGEQQYDNYEEQEEYAEGRKTRKKKKRGGIFILFRMIGRLIKLLIILGIIGMIAMVPACLYFFGMNQRGMLLAGAALVMSILSVLVYKFFSELIR